MFEEPIPSYTFSNLKDLYEALKKHKVFNEYSDACDISVDTRGVITFGMYPAPMSEVFAQQLMKAVNLPKKNLDVLSPERLVGDINYRFEHMPEGTVFGLRIFDEKAYDIYEVKKEKYLLPVNHAKFIELLLMYMPELEEEYKFEHASFDYADGLRLRAYSQNIIELQNGAQFRIGLEFRNRDYNRNVYGSSVSFILKEETNNLLVSGIQLKKHKVKNEASDYLELLVEDTQSLIVNDMEWLMKAVKNLEKTALTPFTVDAAYTSLSKAITKKNANMVLYDFIQDDVYDWKKKVPKPEQNPFHTEYTVFEKLLVDGPVFTTDKFAADETAATIVNTQMMVLKQDWMNELSGV